MSINPALAPAPECDCPSPNGDAITCLAESLHTTRFNAMLLKAKGDIDHYPEQCTCPCHRDVQYRSTESVRREGIKKARAR